MSLALANVGYFTAFAWGDPTQRSLEDQTLVPITGVHPVEMGMAGRGGAIRERLQSDPCYRRAFAAAFPEAGGGITLTTPTPLTQAIAAFERTLIASDSPYDSYLRGDRRALAAPAQDGAALFQSAAMGCADSHAGPHFTDADHPDVSASFHRLAGLAVTPADRGLGEITGKREDDGRFRTPSLQNVALTGPYLHDGSAASIEDAVAAHIPPGKRPTSSQMAALVAFLTALTDERFATDPRFSLPKPQTCPPA